MKSLTACTAAALLVAYGLAQDITSLPECAQQPILEAISASGCGLTDIACICADQNFIDGLVEQIPRLCTPAEQTEVVEFAEVLCTAYGVDVNLPDSIGGGSTSTPIMSSETTLAPTSSIDSTSSAEATITSATGTSSQPPNTEQTTTEAAPSSTESIPATYTPNAAVANTFGTAAVMAMAVGLAAGL